MKIQLSFLKCFSIICLFLFLQILNCSTEVEFQTVEMPPILTDVLSLELTIGGADDTNPSEYLLADPGTIAVNDSNDIFVVDERRIKVFDRDGNPKRIIGRPGMGPGEFGGNLRLFIPRITFGPKGHLTLLEHVSISSSYYSIFSPHYVFQKKGYLLTDSKLLNYLKNHNLRFGGIGTIKIVALDDNKKIYSIHCSERGITMPDSEISYDLLIYENEDTIFTIQKKLRTSYLPKAGRSTGDLGALNWEVLLDGKIIYTHGGHDRQITQDGATYFLHIFSTDSFRESVLSFDYKPLEFTDLSVERFMGMNTPRERERAKYTLDAYKAAKYYPPVYSIKTDGEYVFAFTFEKNDKLEFLVNVIHAVTGERISAIYFPLNPNLIVIKNGYAYLLKSTTDTEFAEIKKYRIAPAVYGK